MGLFFILVNEKVFLSEEDFGEFFLAYLKKSLERLSH
jgi:hypothetical protein